MRKIYIVIFLILNLTAIAFFNPMQFMPKFSQNKYLNLSQLMNDYQPNFERERRIVSQIEDSIIDGEVNWLKSNQGDIFSIYTEADIDKDKPKGGLIILHSRGFHSNWETVIRPLRVGLAESGWDTLSVQMPVLEKDAKYYDYVPILPFARARIQAAIDFYKQKGINNIVLVAHACGAHMTQDFIDKFGIKDISAFVGIGMGATDYKQKNLYPIILTLIDKNIPILDVLAQHDYPGVLRLATIRNEAFQIMQNPKNKQVIIPNTDHYYSSDKATNAMLTSVGLWLDNL